MFISTGERVGGCYLEFCFCKTSRAVKNGKTNCNAVNHWNEDSLLIHDDDFAEFYKLYSDIFSCALFPNGETGFDGCGINYYNKEKTVLILKKLKNKIDKRYEALIPWLEKAADGAFGFYILGI